MSSHHNYNSNMAIYMHAVTQQNENEQHEQQQHENEH